MKCKEKYYFLIVGALILLSLNALPLSVWIEDGYSETKSCSSVKLETMSPETLRSLSLDQRLKWYESKLSSCRQELQESANRHNIPTELLSTIILNELADINLFDVAQEWIGVERGSIGVAQIQIDTAIFHKLVDVSEKEIEGYRNSREAANKSGDEKLSKDQILRLIVGKKLRQPEVAIEAAAREIRKILENIKACSNSAWRDNFLVNGINLNSRNPDQIYRFIKGEAHREKSINLARMVAAPYNSSGIECVENPGNPFSPNDDGPFANPRKRSESAAFIAEDLFNGNLFNE